MLQPTSSHLLVASTRLLLSISSSLRIASLRCRPLVVDLLGSTPVRTILSEASTYIEVLEKRQGLKVACLEGIAYRQGG